jgi:DNA-binding NarL/FixJ family response regulator
MAGAEPNVFTSETITPQISRRPDHEQPIDLPAKLQISDPPKARILVVDNNAFVREGLICLLDGQPDLFCCGEADSIASASAIVTKCKPDLVLTDLRFKDGEAFELINSLALGPSKPAILVLSQCDETLFAERALQAGARGYVMKGEAVNELLGAIRTVLRGRVYLSPNMSARLVQRVLKPGLRSADTEKWSRSS